MKNSNNLKIGLRIRVARNQMGYTQKTLAALLNMSQQNIQKLETGKIHISAIMIYKLSNILHKNISWFFENLDENFTTDDFTDAVLKDFSRIRSTKVKKKFLEMMGVKI